MSTMINQLNNDNRRFLTAVLNLNQGKSESFSVAIAKAMSDTLELPQTKVDDINYHYKLTHKHYVTNILNEINELFSIDYVWIETLTTNFYNQRYQAVNPPEIYFLSNADNAVIEFFNIKNSVDSNVSSIIKENYNGLMFLINGSKKLIAEISAKLSSHMGGGAVRVGHY